MPTSRVDSYQVVTDSRLNQGNLTRQYMIVLTPAQGSPLAVAILFYNADPAIGSAVGVNQIGINFPKSEMLTHLQLLQTEQPIFFLWELDPANAAVVSRFELSTSDEFPGEGYTDMTP
ncbi:hypothetical protein [Actinoplanes sp. NPDC023714]|uniref:hypothetical protein n=1 Tax=Actinoplanes sp. NPDC023714 TaxID=3154322 RepID=UPI0033E08C2F